MVGPEKKCLCACGEEDRESRWNLNRGSNCSSCGNREERYMSKDCFNQIGLDRLVRLEWLERTAALAIDGNDELSIKSTLQHDLAPWFRYQ